MAYEIPGFSWTLVSGVDLSNSQYCGVNINSSGRAVLPVEGARIIGVTRNKPATEMGINASITIVSTGIVFGRVGITGCTAGQNLTVNDDGTFIQASGSNLVHGQALQTVAAGGLVAVLLGLNSKLTGS